MLLPELFFLSITGSFRAKAEVLEHLSHYNSEKRAGEHGSKSSLALTMGTSFKPAKIPPLPIPCQGYLFETLRVLFSFGACMVLSPTDRGRIVLSDDRGVRNALARCNMVDIVRVCYGCGYLVSVNQW